MKNRKKTVLITGSGQGIGQAIAYRFASDKANVVIASKDNPSQVQETIDEISKAGGQALACDADTVLFSWIAHRYPCIFCFVKQKNLQS